MSSILEANTFVSTLQPVNGKWDLVEIIGEGTYGQVYRALDKKKEQVAIKIVENNSNKLDEIQNEISIFKNYSKHPNMVNYVGTYIFRDPKNQPTHIWLVMEYCEGRSVAELAKTMVQNGNNLSENVIKYILYQTLHVVNYLHKSHIIHRDVKGPNILLTIEGHVKLIDYGVSAHLNNTMGRRHSSVGSPFWMAPEVIACEHQIDYNYNNKCDVWSLGITAIELADGDPPLADDHPMRALFKIPRSPPPTVKAPKKWSQEFISFIARALRKDFEERPMAEELMKDPFLIECPNQEKSLRKELMALLHIFVQQYNQTASGHSNTLDAKKRNAKQNVKMLEVHDLATLPKLTEDILLTYITERYNADQIYTYIGEILVAVNPYKELGIYGEGAKLLYQDTKKDALPPHVFMVACNTYQSMLQKKNDQCCVISGESGSGKTMTANFLIEQFANIGKANKDTGVNLKLVKKILQVTPLIEAFGNAQTIINQNSSRFGKYLELHFTESGKLVGAQLSQFLLEKSRVVSQPTAERNFHIMYYMIAGLDFHGRLKDFELDTGNLHRYLNTDELTLAECACTSEMQVRFNSVQSSLENIGFTKNEIQSMYCILAGIIHLGDVNFTIDDFSPHEGEKAKVLNPKTLETVASLLCVDERNLNESMIINNHVARGETIRRNNTIDQAMDCRDATAKALYGNLFLWIVKRINILLRAEDKTEIKHSRIGILDIFGFENLKANSFEQLCINIANEQLQFYFNEYIFVWEFEEYAAEDIKSVPFEFTNNKEILDLFLQKPVGILALLDEESRFPMATDMTLVEKFHDNIESRYMKTKKDASTVFAINHYAEEVSYDTTGFLEKNRDTLSPLVMEILQTSTDETICKLFKEIATSTNTMEGSFDRKHSLRATTSRSQQSVATHFRLSLRSMMAKIIKSDPNFVRCIRPNLQNRSNLCDNDKVMQQLKYTGILETTRIRKQGYSERVTFQQFVNRYKFLLFNESEYLEGTRDICLNLLRETKIDEEETWKLGKTKVFLRYWHAQKLSLIYQQYRKSVIKCQGAIRSFLLKRSMKAFGKVRYNAANKIRNRWLAFIAKKRYLELLKEMNDERERKRKLTSNNDDVEERPFYKNLNRKEDAYLPNVGIDLVGSSRMANVTREIISDIKSGKSNNEEEEIEGRAALEETRSIILLLQIELSCKEICDLLNRTAYPVIHSIRAKTGQSEGGSKMQVQRLNHREKQLAMLDGYGDPLDQTYRHAKLHQGESEMIGEEKEVFQSQPMLGLVDRPNRDQPARAQTSNSTDSAPSSSKKSSIKKSEPPKKLKPKEKVKAAPKETKTSTKQNNKPERGPAKSLNKKPQQQQQQSSVTRKPREVTQSLGRKPENKSRTKEIANFGSTNRVQREKQLVENRVQRATPPSSVNRYPPTSERFNRVYSQGISYDHKPYNYLLNSRKDPRSSLSSGSAAFNSPKLTRNPDPASMNRQPSRVHERQYGGGTSSRPLTNDYHDSSSKPYYDVSKPNEARLQRINGFNYAGSQQDSGGLTDLKLKKTGRLHHLVH